jgi:transposase
MFPGLLVAHHGVQRDQDFAHDGGGAPWRDLPSEFGNWNSVWRQFRRWTQAGLWDVLLQALADGAGDADALQMIDSTIIRAHHCAAGAKGGFRARLSAAHGVAFRAKSTCVPTRTGFRSGSF